MAEKKIVCVTGAGGYVASWLVKFLLSRGYTVNGTVRNPSDEKYSHLKKLEKSSDNLKLFKADMLDYNSLSPPIKYCSGVFHLASPVPIGTITNPEVQMIEPAVKGTQNVLKACSEASVRRVVVMSSLAAVTMNPNWPKGQLKDETCWSDIEFCRTTNNWYHFAKTVAESEAFELAKRSGLDVVSVCPAIVLGPMLQSSMNASSLVLLEHLKDGNEEMENKVRIIVDVRDIVEAMLLLYEKPEAEGRYVCNAHTIKTKYLVEMLKGMYPNYNYPKKFCDWEEIEELSYLSSKKLQRLGWSHRPLEETLVDSIESYKQNGLLN
ncbi:cinnamoyl-CoA reductase 1-like [Cornus florida]|uniref:cinnamoyl-CoA reductase 1-like n=1 Tax=Cornus florida TaxID=4283 RepID=UPI002898DF7F|nr:cinnamoyl-CoA reductase 1-like [Cornus florida]